MDNINNTKQLTLVYVEDDPILDLQARQSLKNHVGQIFFAETCEEGLELFRRFHPDLVICNINMPTMGGFQLAREIKQANKATPVILISDNDDAKHLLPAIDTGIDGYLLKSASINQLIQTIEEAMKRQLANRDLARANARLSAYQAQAEEERRLVAELMSRMMRPEQLHDKQVRYWLKPTDIVSGDLVAVSRYHKERLYLMLADSTGHGLPAALNLLPINHIFYSMVSKGLTVGMIVEEMNWAIHEQSPIGLYVAAVVACIDNHNCTVEVWNGGIPSVHFLDEQGKVDYCFDSNSLPLGILDRTFTAKTEVYQWPDGGQLVIYSDGLVDVENADGEAFGEHRALKTLQEHPLSLRYDALLSALEEFIGNRHAFDDITVMMAECPGGAAIKQKRSIESHLSNCAVTSN